MSWDWVIPWLKEATVIAVWIGVAVAVSWLTWRPRWVWEELTRRKQ